MSTSQSHRLTEVDKGARTANCAVCGPTRIASKGDGRWRCATKKAEHNRRHAKAHPETVRRNRMYRPSPHKLSTRDGSRTWCAKCEEVVEPVAQGRGWMCPNRAKELNRKGMKAPATKCPKCLTVFLTAGGKCLACDDRYGMDLGYALKVDEYSSAREAAEMRRLLGDDFSANDYGFTIVDGETPLDDDYESVVPGWRTLGPPVDPSDRWYPKYVQLKKVRA